MRATAASPLGQLQLDAAVAAVGVLGRAPASSGWNSPKPAATRRCGEMPLPIRYCTTEIARAGGQLPVRGKLRARDRPHVGVAVDAQHPGDVASGSASPARPARSRACRARRARPAAPPPAPASKNTSDWNTKRSPTTRMSGRLPRIARRRPKNSERKRDSSCTRCASARLSRWPRSAMRACDSLSLLSEASSAALERGKLAAQRGDLLVEQLDLRQRARGEALLRVELRRQARSPGCRRSRAPR